MSGTPVPTSLALWLALLAGFSPVIAQFVRTEVWSAPPSTLAGPVLMAICLWRGNAPTEPSRRAGVPVIAAGLLLELIGIALRTWTLAWLGLPVAVLGMSLWLGRPSWRVAVLLFGLVAIPVSIEGAYTPNAESALLSGACAAWRAAGVAFSCTGPVARIGGRDLELVAADVGLALAALLAQLGWFLAVSDGATGLRALRGALAFAAAAIVVQPLAIGVALGLLAVGSATLARAWLSPGVWFACTAGVILWSARPRPGRA